MQDFKKLDVWRSAHRFALEAYAATKSFPRAELFGLTGQLRRAAVSIPCNIAEGCGRDGAGELAHFLSIAMGSATECEYEVLLGMELGYLDSQAHQRLAAQVLQIQKMLSGFRRKVNESRRVTRG